MANIPCYIYTTSSYPFVCRWTSKLLHVLVIINSAAMNPGMCVSFWILVLAPHSSVLAWRIPGTVEPGGLQSRGSHTVRHDWSDLAAAAAGSMPSGGIVGSYGSCVPSGSVVNNLPAMPETWVWSLGLIPGLGKSPGGGHGNPHQ